MISECASGHSYYKYLLIYYYSEAPHKFINFCILLLLLLFLLSVTRIHCSLVAVFQSLTSNRTIGLQCTYPATKRESWRLIATAVKAAMALTIIIEQIIFVIQLF
jgi:hypothetical protein